MREISLLVGTLCELMYKVLFQANNAFPVPYSNIVNRITVFSQQS